MKNFDMLLPKSLPEAVQALPAEDSLQARRAVKVLAGGQDLLGELKDHLEEPETIVNLKGIEGLDRVVPADDGGLEVGALVTLATLEEEPWVRQQWPMLAEAAASVGSPQIRSAGTLGGNLCQRPRCWYYRNEQTLCLKKGGTECYAYEGMSKYNAILGGGPSYIVHPSDIAPALVAYGAQATIAGPEGERTVPLERFFVLPSEGDVTRETRLGPNEILTRVHVPDHSGWRGTYLKVRERDAFDFALSAVALAVRVEGYKIREARLTLGGVAPVPWRCESAEQLMLGRALDDETARLVGEEALRDAEPLEHNGYKIRLTKGLLVKALRKLAQE